MNNQFIPELGEEEEQLISAIHEPIVSEELFQKTRAVLKRIYEKNLSRVEKANDKDELPIRGMLECPKCNSTWTGSGSKGNGGGYFYYHCQNGCKERGKAERLDILEKTWGGGYAQDRTRTYTPLGTRT